LSWDEAVFFFGIFSLITLNILLSCSFSTTLLSSSFFFSSACLCVFFSSSYFCSVNFRLYSCS
jgi:hypothetical protein